MGDQQNRGRVLPVNIQQQILHFNAGQCIQCPKRFVQQQRPGFTRQRPRQRNPLSHSAGDFFGAVRGVVGEPHQAQQLTDALLCSCFWGALGQSERHIIGDGAPGQQARLLKTDCHPLIQPAHRGVADAHLPARNAVKPGGGPQQR